MSLRVCQCTKTLVDCEETFNIQFRTHQNEDKTEGFIVDIPIGRLSVSAKLHFFKSRLSDCLGWIVLLLSLHDALLILRLGLGTKRHLVRFRKALRFGLKRQLPEINSWFWSPSFATETLGNISWTSPFGSLVGCNSSTALHLLLRHMANNNNNDNNSTYVNLGYYCGCWNVNYSHNILATGLFSTPPNLHNSHNLFSSWIFDVGSGWRWPSWCSGRVWVWQCIRRGKKKGLFFPS